MKKLVVNEISVINGGVLEFTCKCLEVSDQQRERITASMNKYPGIVWEVIFEKTIMANNKDEAEELCEQFCDQLPSGRDYLVIAWIVKE